MSETQTQTPNPSETPAADAPADSSLLSAAAVSPATGADAANPDTGGVPKELGGEGAQPVALAAGAPEGAYELKAPEGVTLDADLLGAVSDDFKAANLSPAQAQKLAESAYPKLVERITKSVQTANETAFAEVARTWEAETRADPEFKDFDAAMAKVAAGRDMFPIAGLKEILDMSKVGNHPAVLKFFKAVGEKVSQGPIHNGGADAAPPAKATMRDIYKPETAAAA